MKQHMKVEMIPEVTSFEEYSPRYHHENIEVIEFENKISKSVNDITGTK